MDQFLEQIRYFNSLYFKFDRVENYTQFERFQNFLDIFGTEDNETFYDVLKIVKMVSRLKVFLA